MQPPKAQHPGATNHPSPTSRLFLLDNLTHFVGDAPLWADVSELEPENELDELGDHGTAHYYSINGNVMITTIEPTIRSLHIASHSLHKVLRTFFVLIGSTSSTNILRLHSLTCCT